ncbi:MAG: hypothetical protein DMF97_07575 [Acidobacteria bacterium]|nr:MAG: hypothetical protein DMF97_07575 [Acidobacteriota bacterium]
MRVVQRAGRRAERVLGFGPRDRFAVGGLLGGILRALPRIEGVIQGETIVALPDGVVRALQRGLRRGELVGRVLVGAGRPGGIDGALRLDDMNASIAPARSYRLSAVRFQLSALSYRPSRFSSKGGGTA